MPDAGPDLYALLEVPRTATRQEISRAYRRLLRIYHPDTRPGGPEDAVHPADARRLERIMQAYAVLDDPQRRAEYDRRTAPVRAAQSYIRPVTPVSGTRVSGTQPYLRAVSPLRRPGTSRLPSSTEYSRLLDRILRNFFG